MSGHDPSAEAPHVLIAGGLLTSPPLYARMRGRLLERGAASVAIAPIWLPDWLLLPRTGYGPLLRRAGRAVVAAYRASGGRPLLAIGHSAGGVVLRLAMSPVPYEGRRAAIAEAIGCLVTLGTPHHVRDIARLQRPAIEASTFLETTQPGAFFAPRTQYVTVSSRAVPGGGADEPDRRRRLAGSFYAALLGEDARLGDGDGLIPVASAHLEGARQITLETIGHGQAAWSSWYGDQVGLDGWWEAALAAWREALAARAVR
jgi:hypothetical protein